MLTTSKRLLLSVVLPCYNEEAVLGETHRRLGQVCAGMADLDVEFVYVNDGSSDSTGELLAEFQAMDERVRVIEFSRTFGRQMALTAGIEHAAGDAIVLIDAGLRDPPELVHEFVARWREGYHVAYGIRTDRPGENAFNVATSDWLCRLLGKLSATSIPLGTGDFQLMDRCVVNALSAMPERDRFVRGMAAWVGFNQVAVPYTRAPRLAGESRYPLSRMIHFMLDSVASFSAAPLHLTTWLGFTASALALLGVGYAVVLRLFTNIWVTGWTALFIAVLFVGGIQLLALGVIGEYIGRIYAESKQRPLYFVQERLGFDPVAPTAIETPPVYREPELAHRETLACTRQRTADRSDERVVSGPADCASVTIGSVIATVAITSSIAVSDAMAALITLLALQEIVRWLQSRNLTVHHAVREPPRVLLWDGALLEDRLRESHVSADEVRAAVRKAGLRALSEARVVVLENDGEWSVVTKSGDPIDETAFYGLPIPGRPANSPTKGGDRATRAPHDRIP